jgi:hypothetical protein
MKEERTMDAKAIDLLSARIDAIRGICGTSMKFDACPDGTWTDRVWLAPRRFLEVLS